MNQWPRGNVQGERILLTMVTPETPAMGVFLQDIRDPELFFWWKVSMSVENDRLQERQNYTSKSIFCSGRLRGFQVPDQHVVVNIIKDPALSTCKKSCYLWQQLHLKVSIFFWTSGSNILTMTKRTMSGGGTCIWILRWAIVVGNFFYKCSRTGLSSFIVPIFLYSGAENISLCLLTSERLMDECWEAVI